jgi:hypothetical protein
MAEVFICSSAPSSTPYDVFIISVDAQKQSKIEYQRFPFFGAEILPFTQAVQGCAPAQYATVTATEVYVECDGDGDAGYVSLDRVEGQITGTVNFPEGNIGYKEDTSLAVFCRQQ